MSWKLTRTGRAFDLTDPRPEDVSRDDIAVSLSRIPRWGGHTTRVISVAEHCVRVSRRVHQITGSRNAAQAGLLHDAEETYTGDIPTPTKALYPGIREWCSGIRRVIFARFGVPWPEPPEVKIADREWLATEARWLMPEPPRALCDPADVLDVERVDILTPITEHEARRMFIMEGRALGLWC